MPKRTKAIGPKAVIGEYKRIEGRLEKIHKRYLRAAHIHGVLSKKDAEELYAIYRRLVRLQDVLQNVGQNRQAAAQVVYMSTGATQYLRRAIIRIRKSGEPIMAANHIADANNQLYGVIDFLKRSMRNPRHYQ